MPKFNVNRSILINAEPQTVHQYISNFNEWVKWSPWLIMDQEAKVDIAEDGKSYQWEGPLTGSGNMEILEETSQLIHYDLNFIKPWKSNSKVSFRLDAENGHTKVSWLMNSSLPFFMFWMKKQMTAFVGNDYDRGLLMLKDLVEEGNVHSKLNIIGKSSIDGFNFVGIKRTTSLEESSNKMGEDIGKLSPYGSMKDVFVQYHKWDFVKRIAEYTAGIKVAEIIKDLPEDIQNGSIPSTAIFTMEHVGPYHHLGNAWSTMYGMQRGKVFKLKKSIHPFETYLNDPNSTPPEELITRIHFPIKDG